MPCATLRTAARAARSFDQSTSSSVSARAPRRVQGLGYDVPPGGMGGRWQNVPTPPISPPGPRASRACGSRPRGIRRPLRVLNCPGAPCHARACRSRAPSLTRGCRSRALPAIRVPIVPHAVRLRPVAHMPRSLARTCRRASHGHVTVASPRELRRGEQPIRGTLVWFFIDFERRGRAGFFPAQTPRHRALHRILRRRRGLADTTQGRAPLTYIEGNHEVVPGFEVAVLTPWNPARKRPCV